MLKAKYSWQQLHRYTGEWLDLFHKIHNFTNNENNVCFFIQRNTNLDHAGTSAEADSFFEAALLNPFSWSAKDPHSSITILETNFGFIREHNDPPCSNVQSTCSCSKQSCNCRCDGINCKPFCYNKVSGPSPAFLTVYLLTFSLYASRSCNWSCIHWDGG